MQNYYSPSLPLISSSLFPHSLSLSFSLRITLTSSDSCYEIRHRLKEMFILPRANGTQHTTHIQDSRQ